MNKTIVSLLATALAVSALSAQASARPKHHRAPVVVDETGDINAIPLTVNRRSWLDPGPVAPVGTGNKYMTANTGQFITSPIHDQSPDGFGRDALPGQPYVPGRSYPTVEFSTLPDGRVDVANTLLPQNYYFNPAPWHPPENYQPSLSPEFPDTP